MMYMASTRRIGYLISEHERDWSDSPDLPDSENRMVLAEGYKTFGSLICVSASDWERYRGRAVTGTNVRTEALRDAFLVIK